MASDNNSINNYVCDTRGFVNLRDVDSTIIQSVRYATSENFVGHPLPGYDQPAILMTRECALALSNAQKLVNRRGYNLVVYDAYRPQRTVDFFYNAWRHEPNNPIGQQRYYPSLTKQDIFDHNYVARRSSHTRGSTVDLSLISLSQSLFDRPVFIHRELGNYLDDNTLDMGTSFDMFSDASHHGSPRIDERQELNRQILLDAMEHSGFKKYPEEWWHYTLVNEPYPDTYFNFDVKKLIGTI